MKSKTSNFIALDIGSSKIIGIAAHIDKKGEIKVLNQTIHVSEGIKSGFITDLKTAENSIIGAIYALEKESDRNIKNVNISLSGAATKSYYVNHKIKIHNQHITKNDLKKLIQKSLDEFKVKDQEIIHCVPVQYILDENHIDNPIGMVAREIGCQLHIITANTSLMTNLTNCLAKYQVEISSVTLAIYASGIACLSEDEKDLGAIIVDIGSRTTSFGIFFTGKLIYTGHIPLGAANITADIAKLFSLNFNSAEKLKVLYGSAISSKLDKDYIINLEDFENITNLDLYGGNITISANHLNAIIQSRMEEIFSSLKTQYDKTNVDHLIARRLVVTGGGAMLKGTKELANRIFDKQTRIAKPTTLNGFEEGYNPTMYATAAGMIQLYAEKQRKSSSEIDPVDVNSDWIKKTITWLKENI